MVRITSLPLPELTVSVPLLGEIRFKVPTKEQFDEMSRGGGDDPLPLFNELCININEDAPTTKILVSIALKLMAGEVENFFDEAPDIFGLCTGDPTKVSEACKLPIMLISEKLVSEYTGLDMVAVRKLPMIDYRLAEADALKYKILRSADGKGIERLNRQYQFFHKISDDFSQWKVE